MSADDAGFRRLAEFYAQACDRNLPALMEAIMAEDAVVEGPGFRLEGRAAIRTIPASLGDRFRATRHVVENQIVKVDGDAAVGETYGTANHLYNDSVAGPQILVWHVRYQDRFVLGAAGWLFAERRLVLDWIETRSVTVPGG